MGRTRAQGSWKLLTCVPTHRLAQPGSLAVGVGFDDPRRTAYSGSRCLLRDRPLSQLQRPAGSPAPRHARYPAGLAGHGSQVRDRRRGTPFPIAQPTQACLVLAGFRASESDRPYIATIGIDVGERKHDRRIHYER